MTSKLFDLTGRMALVTGGSRGLGKAMATIFAEAGAGVVISSRHEDELQAAAAEIRDKTAARVEYVVADMTRREDVPTPGHHGRGPHGQNRHPGQQRGSQPAAGHRPDPRRGLGPAGGVEPDQLHGPDPRPGAGHEGAALGAGHPHLVDHGPGQHGGAERLLRHEGAPCWAWPVPAPWTWGPSTLRSTASPRAPSPPRCRCRSSARSSRPLWPPARR